MKPLHVQISKESHQKVVSDLCFLGLFALVDELNPKKLKGIFMQHGGNINLKDVMTTFFESSVIHQLSQKMIQPLYILNFDLNLYADYLLICKSIL
jgi:hypothetical protein